MNLIALILFWLSIFVIVYVYFGYFVILSLVSIFTKKDKKSKKDVKQKITLLISAFNEERVINEKIRNSLSQVYPEDLLEIVVISDASQDRTDEIVGQFKRENVKLIRMKERKGKTAGINAVIPIITGDIIVFSDANAFYNPDVLKKLVRNFADPEVGYVTGESRYFEDNGSPAAFSESSYWSYETRLKKLETRIGSMVGADGAIYAIRKELFQPLTNEAINDFVNPLKIIAMGYKGVYEPEAICYEKASGDFKSEFKRKRRIVNRSWHGLFSVKEILNPFKYAVYAFEIISHKLLRWLIPFFLAIIFISNLFLIPVNSIYVVTLFLQIGFYMFALGGYWVNRVNRNHKKIPKLFFLPFYFCLVNLASAIGIIDNFTGHVIYIWNPERN